VASGSKTSGQRFERTFAQDDQSAPRLARNAVGSLVGIDARLRRDLTIIVSELVANSVRHAPRVEGGRIVLSVREVPGAFRVEVRDPGHGFDPTPDESREGGLGLLIVGHLAVDWGMLDGAGTTVWCEVPVSP
jgi:anti-sigma regulatory factor (Ser/Thr protein kinase)